MSGSRIAHLRGCCHDNTKKIFPLYAPICMNALAFLAASHSATTLSVGVPFIERPKKQVRFGSIPKSALLKSRRPYWGSKKLCYFLLGRTSDRPAPRVRAWVGKSFPLEPRNIVPIFQDRTHPESPIGIGVAMEAAPVAWSVFFCSSAGRPPRSRPRVVHSGLLFTPTRI